MKKSYLFGMFALAAMTMVGCSNDEVVENFSQDNAIEFGTYVGRDVNSRAVVVNEYELAKYGFGVFAYYSKGTYDASQPSTFKANFMNNQKVETTWSEDDAVEKDDYVWTYTPVKYWPNNANDYVSFIAYAPYVANKTFSQANPGKIDFTVEPEAKKQTDLIWSNTNNLNKRKSDQDVTTTSKVLFNFGHALSRIGFNISAAVDETTKESGDLDDNTTIFVDKVELSQNFAKTGILDLTAQTAAWTPGTELQGFTLDYIKDNADATELQNNILKGTDDDAEAEKQLNKDDSYLMIIPNNTEFTLTVTYRVFTKDPALTDTVDELGADVKGSLVTNTIPVDVTVDFQAGTAYTFNIILGMTSVKLDVNFTPWTDAALQDEWFNENKDN